MSVFEKLSSIDVSDHVDVVKSGRTSLKYVSWTHAWAGVVKEYPEANYEVVKQPNGLPYVYDPNTGYMVSTTVTIDGITREMWLFVMDGANKAMKAERYSYKVKDWKNPGQFVDKWVEPASMFDINKTIMRCMVKNLAMFGFAIHIYAGEDLPMTQPKPELITDEQKQRAIKIVGDDMILTHCLKQWKTTLDTMTVDVYANFLPWTDKLVAKQRAEFCEKITKYHTDNETHHKEVENSYMKHFGTLDLNQVSTQKLREYKDLKTKKEEVKDV